MNNHRLSTSNKPVVDRQMLLSEIDKLINISSNYEVQEDGKVFIKSLRRYRKDTSPIAVELLEVSTGNIINSFSSIAESAKFLDVSYPTTLSRVRSGKPFEFQGIKVYLKAPLLRRGALG